MNKIGSYYKRDSFDWNLFYKYDLKYTQRCIEAYLKPTSQIIKIFFIKVKKKFRKQSK